MTRFLRAVQSRACRVARDNCGAVAVEYGVLLLIAIGVLGVALVFGRDVAAMIAGLVRQITG